ncbi:DUF6193 family natural product biosynthesis protein [Streptomyces sp. NPDC001941]|uniref:DUF6193 family natural product biosynthesis protein n=1 Tax=Streptomyces sp. NPDC001941 TaxID=3154659 RepID=UPI0033167899
MKWRMLHDQAAEGESLAAFGELVRVSYAEPRLRRLSAFASHWVLGFSTSVHPRARPVIALAPAGRAALPGTPLPTRGCPGTGQYSTRGPGTGPSTRRPRARHGRP